MKKVVLMSFLILLLLSFCEKKEPCGEFDTLEASDDDYTAIAITWTAPCTEAYDYDIYKSTSRKGPFTKLQTVCEENFSDYATRTDFYWNDPGYLAVPTVPGTVYYYKAVAKPYLNTEWDGVTSNITTGMALPAEE